MPTIKGLKIVNGKIPEEMKKYITLPFKADNFSSTKDAGMKVEPIGVASSHVEEAVPETKIEKIELTEINPKVETKTNSGKPTYTYAELKNSNKAKQVEILKTLGVKGVEIPALEEVRIKKILELTK